MRYYILDQSGDAARLIREIGADDATLVPISAIALSDLPSDWPADRVLRLSALLSPSTLTELLVDMRQVLRALYAGLIDCPYYKTYQIIDVFLEKRVIVEVLAELNGTKFFIDQRKAWLAADGDNDERLRVAATFMRDRPGFVAAAVERMPSAGSGMRRFARRLAEAWRARGGQHSRFVLGPQTGYGTAAQFPDDTRRINGGLLLLRAFARPMTHWCNAWLLLTHDRPVPLPDRSSCTAYPFLETLNIIQKRAAMLSQTAAHCLPPLDGVAAFFTVNYGPLIDAALVRAVRRQGVPVVSMQHALMGHDRWTASQYLDTWLSDAKIVSTSAVAESMKTFEDSRGCAYLPATLPILRRSLRPASWNSDRLLYVLTGFTRANTMYDQRRVNDALYFDLVARKLAAFTQHFSTLLRPHPYDLRQYGGRIPIALAARHGAKLCTDPLDKSDAAIIIDSPSTILADAMFAGRPVFILNETASLQPEFTAMAKAHSAAFDSAETLIDYLLTTDRVALAKRQDAFAHAFAARYFGNDRRPLYTVIEDWLSSATPIAASRGAC